jgi:endonuclease YncB( thermonuclease family)
MIAKILAALLLTTSASAAGSIFVVDGDTINDGQPGNLRLLAIDAPETIRSHCTEEHLAGLVAKKRLTELLAQGEVTVERHEKDPWGHKDRYGRTFAQVWVNTDDGPVDVGSVLIAEGLALRYQPGPVAKSERINHWCPGTEG